MSFRFLFGLVPLINKFYGYMFSLIPKINRRWHKFTHDSLSMFQLFPSCDLELLRLMFLSHSLKPL